MSRTLPILCSASVVRNILANLQTEDRRPVKRQPPPGEEVWPCHWVRSGYSFTRTDGEPPMRGCTCGGEVRAPWAPGDVLYVRETWRPCIRGWSSHVQYQAGTDHRPDRPVVGASLGPDESDAAMNWQATRGGVAEYDGQDPDTARWFPSIHMPKWAARIHLRVLSVGVERVGDITEEGAKAEGVEADDIVPNAHAYRDAFGRLWDSLYGAGAFERNGWCWVTRFERVMP